MKHGNETRTRPEIPLHFSLWRTLACQTWDISSAIGRIAPDLLKGLAILYQIQLSEDQQLIEETWNHTRNQKKDRISRENQRSNFLHLSTNNRRKTNKAVGFSHRSLFPTFLKTRTTGETFNNLEKKIHPNTYRKDPLICLKVQFTVL